MVGWAGQIKIKDHLSPAEAETGAELGNLRLLIFGVFFIYGNLEVAPKIMKTSIRKSIYGFYLVKIQAQFVS